MPPGPSPRKQHTQAEKQRVLDTYRTGDTDWRVVAVCNGIPLHTAYYLIRIGRADNKPRGGARASRTKCTPAILDDLEAYINKDCDLTLVELQELLRWDHDVVLSTSTTSRRLTSVLYTVTQTRIEPTACNSEVNKLKRKEFAEKPLNHSEAGDCIVYFDETNYNLFCKRGRGRAKRGERAVVTLPASKGPNLQIQCAVSSTIGLDHYRTNRGSIRMEQNAEFVEQVYNKVKVSPEFALNHAGKNVVVVFDNAPCYQQTEQRVTEHDDMVMLRFAHYSPMYNPIEGCFSVVKARVKRCLVMSREELQAPSPRDGDGDRPLTLKERRMQQLEHAAHISMRCIKPGLVVSMELHARKWVNFAKDLKDMEYGS